MQHYGPFLTLLLLLSLCSCGPADAPTEAPAQPTAPPPAAEDANAAAKTPERNENLAAPPPVCFFLSEAEVRSVLPGALIPMPGHRSTTGYNTCQYGLEHREDNWSATLIVEMPEQTPDIQAIRDEVAAGRGKERTTVGGEAALIQNDGRIISVDGKQVFRVKFSALPNGGGPAPFDAAQRRAIIRALAEAVQTT